MISIISALNNKYVIGDDNKLLWHIRQDLLHFREKVAGNTVIMGRNTYESMLGYYDGKPMSKVNNIVVSRTLQDDRVEVYPSLEEAIKAAEKYHRPVWLIGGNRIYKEGLEIADEMWLSHVNNDLDGDTVFPRFNEDNWNVVFKRDYKKDGELQFTLKKYIRK